METALWPLGPVTTFLHIGIEQLSDETFYRQTHSGMISGERRKRTTVALQGVVIVRFLDRHRRAELVIQQGTGGGDSGSERRVGNGRSGERGRERSPGAAHQVSEL